jgi:hypothetical protein
MKNKKSKVVKVANTSYIIAMRELRRSNKAVTHDNRPSRQRTRSTVRRNATSDGW